MLFQHKHHPNEMGATEVEAFLPLIYNALPYSYDFTFDAFGVSRYD